MVFCNGNIIKHIDCMGPCKFLSDLLKQLKLKLCASKQQSKGSMTRKNAILASGSQVIMEYQKIMFEF